MSLDAGPECPAVEDELRYLQGIERRALAEVVVHGPQGELVRLRASADPADEDLVTACGRSRGREVFERDVRRRAENRPRLDGRQWLFGLDPDRLSVSYEDWDPDAGGLDGEVGQAEDLLRLGAELRLLAELVILQFPVHREVGLHRRHGAQALDARIARAGHRLVGRQPDSPQAGGFVQRLEEAGELNGRAVRVRDDRAIVDRLVVHPRD